VPSFWREISLAMGAARRDQLKPGRHVAVVFDEKLDGVHRFRDRPCILRTC
jgi:hypothetical protein